MSTVTQTGYTHHDVSLFHITAWGLHPHALLACGRQAVASARAAAEEAAAAAAAEAARTLDAAVAAACARAADAARDVQAR